MHGLEDRRRHRQGGRREGPAVCAGEEEVEVFEDLVFAAGAMGGTANGGEQEITGEVAGHADADGDAGQPGNQRGAEGMRQDIGRIQVEVTQGASGVTEAAGFEGQDAGRGGVHGPERSDAGLDQEREVGPGLFPAERLQRGHGEDGVAQPIDAAHENAPRRGGDSIFGNAGGIYHV